MQTVDQVPARVFGRKEEDGTGMDFSIPIIGLLSQVLL